MSAVAGLGDVMMLSRNNCCGHAQCFALTAQFLTCPGQESYTMTIKVSSSFDPLCVHKAKNGEGAFSKSFKASNAEIYRT